MDRTVVFPAGTVVKFNRHGEIETATPPKDTATKIFKIMKDIALYAVGVGVIRDILSIANEK
jgi:hypothetical protein